MKQGKITLGKLIAGLVGGVMVSAVGVPLSGILLAPLGIVLEPHILLTTGLFFTSTLILALLTSRKAKAWRLVLIGSSSLCLGLSAVHLLPGAISLQQGQSSDTVGVITFFVGVVVLLIGLLTGRDRITYELEPEKKDVQTNDGGRD